MLIEMVLRFERPAKFDGWCRVCGAHRNRHEIRVVKLDEAWQAVCREHLHS